MKDLKLKFKAINLKPLHRNKLNQLAKKEHSKIHNKAINWSQQMKKKNFNIKTEKALFPSIKAILMNHI